MPKRNVKTWDVDGETKLLNSGESDGFRKAHAIIRAHDFTHGRVVGFAYRLEHARLCAAAPELLEVLEEAVAVHQSTYRGTADTAEEHTWVAVARAAIAKAKP